MVPPVSERLAESRIGAAGAERLTNAVIWAYSAPRIAFGIMGTLFATYLMKFSTDVLLIAPAAMGALIAASRLWDAISDPLAGFLSDNTRSKYGRRRVWLFAASIPVSLGLVMMWSPPSMLEGMELVIWMGIALLVYETASTAFYVPHGALGVELTPNYHERTRLFGYSHMIGAIGMILGLVSLQLMNMAEDKRSFAVLISMFAAVCVTMICIGSTWLLPERTDYQGRGNANMVKSFLDVVRNPHARLLLIMYAIETFGGASVALLVPYLVEYVLPMTAYMVPILVLYVVPQFAFTPVWIWLSRRYGKKRLWSWSMWMSASFFGSGYFLLQPGEFSIMIWFGAFMLGTAAGGAAVMAPAIKADIIDYDEYQTHERKEGAYLAVWNLIRKSAASLTALVTGLVLQYFDFVPNVEQTLDTQYAILALFTLLPGSCYVIGALIFSRFSFNEAEHEVVRKALAARS
jgi:GPH family glycoside/pentoside/hexuronide:cation symporter